MKKWVFVIGLSIGALLIAVSLVGTAFAGGPIKLFVNGRELKPDVPVRLVGGRAVAPVRWIAEALGAGVEWDESSQTIRIVTRGEVENLLYRLRALEPEEPQTITQDYRSEQIAKFLAENKIVPVSEVMKEGKGVSFEVMATDETWVRPSYYESWHSTFMGGKFSRIEHIVFYASHNFYTFYGGASETSGILNGLGLGNEHGKAVATKEPGKGVGMLAIKANIKEVKVLGDQVAVVVEPKLAGYQTIWLEFSELGLSQGERKPFLLQYVTPEGYELERDVNYWP